MWKWVKRVGTTVLVGTLLFALAVNIVIVVEHARVSALPRVAIDCGPTPRVTRHDRALSVSASAECGNATVSFPPPPAWINLQGSRSADRWVQTLPGSHIAYQDSGTGVVYLEPIDGLASQMALAIASLITCCLACGCCCRARRLRSQTYAYEPV